MTVFDILIIDDDEDNYHSLKNYAFEKNVVLKYSRTLEDGITELENNQRILAIILDGKGLIRKSQMPSEANAAFVHEALTQIRLLEEKRKKKYPKCVYTAWYDNLKESLEGRGVRVFDKKKLANDERQKQELFDYLMVQAADSLEYSIRSKYEAVFKFFDERYISTIADTSFFNCCAAIERGNPAPSDFNTIRQLYELVIQSINKNDKSMMPDEVMFSSGRVNLEWSTRFLGGLQVGIGNNIIAPKTNSRVPHHVHDCASFIKEISSAFSHNHNNNFTVFGYKSAFYAWIELFLWYTGWVDKLKTS
jgi:hypothetical protein